MLLSHRANPPASRNISDLCWQRPGWKANNGINPAASGLPGSLAPLGLCEPTMDLAHRVGFFLLIMLSHSGLYGWKLIMKNYRRVLTGRVTDPGLSGLIKVYASTSSATEVGGGGGGNQKKKKIVGLEEESLPLFSSCCLLLVTLSSCIRKEKRWAVKATCPWLLPKTYLQ